jgi:hypothetical protein
MPSLPCAVCAYADAHGSWPTDHAGTHCRVCHRSWASTAQAHCTVCHAHFVANGVAGLHWRNGRHLDPSEVAGLFLCMVDGIWSTSPDRDPDARRERLAARRQNGRSNSVRTSNGFRPTLAGPSRRTRRRVIPLPPRSFLAEQRIHIRP